MKKIKFQIIILLFLELAACTKVPITGRKQVNLLPESQMMSMSLVQYNDFLSKNPPMSESIASTKQVKRVGNRIAHAVEQYLNKNGFAKRVKNYNWEFNLVNNNVMNAWCMPGGKVVVYSGIMPVTVDDDGLAVVLSHEISHAIARHGNERMSQGLLAAAGAVSLAVALNDKPKETQALFLSAYGIASGVGILAFSRNQESEADKMGMVFMAMAGYQPKAAIPFWERMKSSGGGSNIPEFLSTHPSDDTRIKRITDWLPVAESYYQSPKN